MSLNLFSELGPVTPIKINTGNPVLLPIKNAPIGTGIIGTFQNMWQQYQVRVYNADGTLTTKDITYAQLLNQLPNYNFSPEDASKIAAITQTEQAQILQSANISPNAAAALLQDALKVDYLLGMKSVESLPVEFNTLQTPSLDAELVYDFYVPGEDNITTEEDQSQDPLIKGDDAPRYVHLTWDVTAATQKPIDFASRTVQEAKLASSFFNDPKGVQNIVATQIANDYKSNVNKSRTVSQDGQSLKLVDTHELERAFNSTSNSRLFKNAALTVLNTNSVDVDTINFSEILLEDL